MTEWIDYSGESRKDKPSLWTLKAFKLHFFDEYRSYHRIGGAIVWSIKEQTLLSRMITEFSSTDLANMITYWHKNTSKASVAYNFTNFYSQRIQIYHKMIEQDKDFSWT